VTFQLGLDSLAVWSVPTNLPQKDAKQCFQPGNAPWYLPKICPGFPLAANSFLGAAKKTSGKLTKNYWTWPFSSWIYPLKLVIFHSYVKSPEGNIWDCIELDQKINHALRRVQAVPHVVQVTRPPMVSGWAASRHWSRFFSFTCGTPSFYADTNHNMAIYSNGHAISTYTYIHIKTI